MGIKKLKKKKKKSNPILLLRVAEQPPFGQNRGGKPFVSGFGHPHLAIEDSRNYFHSTMEYRV
jgi:hypothetical protein